MLLPVQWSSNLSKCVGSGDFNYTLSKCLNLAPKAREFFLAISLLSMHLYKLS